METVESFDAHGYTVTIYGDYDAESPRSWDNLGTMLYRSSRYTLGDVDARTLEDECAGYIGRDPDSWGQW